MQNLSYRRLTNCISLRSLRHFRLTLRKAVCQRKRAERDANIDLKCFESRESCRRSFGARYIAVWKSVCNIEASTFQTWYLSLPQTLHPLADP